MKSIKTSLVLAAVITCLMAPQAFAQDSATNPSGTWAWFHKAKSGKKTDCELTIVEKNGKVSCTFSAGKKTYKSDSGSFQDGVFKVTIPTKKGKNYVFEGKVAKKTLKGKYSVPSDENKKIEWTAKKTLGLSDVVGKWGLSFTPPNSDPVEPVITLSKNDEGKVVVVFENGDDGPSMVSTEASFKRGVLNVITDVEFDGQELEVEWDLEFEGKLIDGKLYYLFKSNGQEGELDVEGEKIK